VEPSHALSRPPTPALPPSHGTHALGGTSLVVPLCCCLLNAALPAPLLAAGLVAGTPSPPGQITFLMRSWWIHAAPSTSLLRVGIAVDDTTPARVAPHGRRVELGAAAAPPCGPHRWLADAVLARLSALLHPASLHVVAGGTRLRAARARGARLRGGGDYEEDAVGIPAQEEPGRRTLTTTPRSGARRAMAPRTMSVMVVIGPPRDGGEWRGGCIDGSAGGLATMVRPLAVEASLSAPAIVSIPPTRRADHCTATCVPPSSSDGERQDSSGGHVQDNCMTAAAVFNAVVIPLSLHIVQPPMLPTSFNLCPTRACGVGWRVQGRLQGSSMPPLHLPSDVRVHGV
jgi:hypothetical protein